MNAHFRQELYSLACAQRQEQLALRSYWQPFDNSHLAQDLYRLACRVRNVESMTNADVLPTFFTPRAVRQMEKMPNLYWFWWVIIDSIIADCGDEHELLSLESVNRGILAVQREHGRKYDLRKPLAALADAPKGDARREAQIASRAACGLILIQNHFGELDEMRDNPLFFGPHFLI